MADVQLDNPAARLFLILTRIGDLVKPGGSMGGANDAYVLEPTDHRRAVNEALQLEESVPSTERTKLIAETIALPDATRSELSLLGQIIDTSMITGWVDRVRVGLELFFFRAAEMGTLRGLANEPDMAYIALCSDLLHRHRAEVAITEQKLAELRVQIADLLQEVDADPVLDVELRKILISHLREMLAAIDSAPIWGTARLQKAVAETIGDLAVHWQVVTTKSGSSPKTWEKVTSVLAALTAMFSFGTTVFQAIEGPATPALPPAEVQIINQAPGGSFASFPSRTPIRPVPRRRRGKVPLNSPMLLNLGASGRAAGWVCNIASQPVSS